MKKEVRVVTSKESKSGAMLTYISEVEFKGGEMVLSDTHKVSYSAAHSLCVASSQNPEDYGYVVWAYGLNENEVAEKVAEKFAELAGTYSVENETAEVEVEVEVESAEVTVAAATFETVEIKAAVITISKYGVFYKAVKIFSKAIKIAAISKDFNGFNGFTNVSNFINFNCGIGNANAEVFNLAAGIEKLKAGGVSIRGSPYFKGLTPFFY